MNEVDTKNVQNDLTPLTGLQDCLGNRKAYRSKEYTLEWGVRKDDNALILHVYPPLEETEYGPAVGEWADADVSGALDEALPKLFDTNRLTAGFQQEENSFYIIAGGYGGVLSVRGLVERFQQLLDEALASADASGMA